MTLDERVLRALRVPGDLSDPVGPRWLELLATDITSLGGHTVLTLLVLVVSGFLLLSGRRATAGVVLVSAVGAALLSALLKELIDRARPDVVAHLVGVSTPSFPSGHAMLSAAVYLTLGALLAREFPGRALRRYFLAVSVLLTVLIGASRVYLGVHWPTDVLAGWCLGALWAGFALRLSRPLQR